MESVLMQNKVKKQRFVPMLTTVQYSTIMLSSLGTIFGACTIVDTF